MVATLALLAALVIGVGDYWGGRAAARHPALTVVFISQMVAAGLAVPVVVALGWTDLHRGDLVLGALAGGTGGVATIAFFHGLAGGRMSVVAPITAAVGALAPVLVDLATGLHLHSLTWVGIVIALVALPLVVLRPGGDHVLSVGSELALAVVSGFGYAAYFILLGHTSQSSGQWPVAASFTSGAVVLGLIVAARRVHIPRPPLLAVGSGVASIVAGLCITRALQIGPIAVAAVLGSLYPLITSGLAWRLDGERLSRTNVAGILTAVAGAALIASHR